MEIKLIKNKIISAQSIIELIFYLVFWCFGLIENIFERELKRQSVFTDKNKISPHYAPEELPFRENEINEISALLAQTIRDKKADNLFVYGKTGSGKTVTVKHVTSRLVSFAKEKNALVESIYVNCRTHNSKYRVMLKLNQELCPNDNFLGFSYAFVYENLLSHCNNTGKQLIIVLDEVDLVKDLDDLIYALCRGNDELAKGGMSIIGISNNVFFKERLDPRTKSSLCEKEMVFKPYNARELKEILKQRALLSFKENTVQESALNCAAAIAAQESGDARTAVMLLQRAGEIADEKNSLKVGFEEVEHAKKRVEEEITYSLISSLPEQQKLVLQAIAWLSSQKKGVQGFNVNPKTANALFSGEIYDSYCSQAKELGFSTISARWFQEIINELEMYGFITTMQSGKGIRGNTRLIRLAHDPNSILRAIKKELN